MTKSSFYFSGTPAVHGDQFNEASLETTTNLIPLSPQIGATTSSRHLLNVHFPSIWNTVCLVGCSMSQQLLWTLSANAFMTENPTFYAVLKENPPRMAVKIQVLFENTELWALQLTTHLICNGIGVIPKCVFVTGSRIFTNFWNLHLLFSSFPYSFILFVVLSYFF